MKLQFPDHFHFGTSTSAVQIETAFNHDWQGFKARDNSILTRTTDHELLWEKDVEIISSLAPNYRMSFMWSRLQRAPFATFDTDTVNYYRSLLVQLKKQGVDIMLVLHHFANPVWFSEQGGWSNKESVDWWLDYVKKVVHEFGEFVSYWNTFNEPNIYISFSTLAGMFPPQKTNPFYAWRVLNNISDAHKKAYEILRVSSGKPIGISHNASILEEDNFMGKVPAKISDWWFMHFIPGWFENCDFFGMSYYSRIGYDPLPVTFLTTPEKIIKKDKLHDDIWEYYPEGLGVCLERYWKRFRKPIIITENGMCTGDDTQRVKSIYDYMRVIHDCIEKGVDVRGYYHWSTWDNFEWNLGQSYRFGLYSCDSITKERIKKPSADVYSALAYSKELTIPTYDQRKVLEPVL